jgi:TM2 domain-containing membrane protein YozV
LAQPDEAAPQTQAAAVPAGVPVGNPYLAMVLAWLVPGLGHVYLKRTGRGLVFLLLTLLSLWVGCALHGNLYRPLAGQPLTFLATAGAMGMGLPYFILRYGSDYAGDIVGAGYEYGTAFLLTAGLMNWLLVLDAWDISRGKKE